MRMLFIVEVIRLNPHHMTTTTAIALTATEWLDITEICECDDSQKVRFALTISRYAALHRWKIVKKL